MTSALFERVLREAYPSSWNQEEFRSLKTFTARSSYCRDCLERLVAGSGREVFAIDDEKVLKLARNAKGRAQNEAEASIYNDYMSSKSVLAPVLEYDSSDETNWIEMARAERMSPRAFQRLVGFKFENLELALREEFAPRSCFHHPDEGFTDTELWDDLRDLIYNFDLEYYDYGRLSSWGVVGGRPVLIDYGLTKEIFRDFYSRR